MRHVVGTSSIKDNILVSPLEVHGRIRFDTFNFHSLGYFGLFSDSFEKYAQRDAGIGIEMINVEFCLTGSDLVDAMSILERIENDLRSGPNSWRPFIGHAQFPGESPRRVEPLLFKNRALAIVKALKAMTAQAISQGKCLVYGNGVCYRSLCGIKLPPGTVEYS